VIQTFSFTLVFPHTLCLRVYIDTWNPSYVTYAYVDVILRVLLDSQEVCRPDQRCVNTFGSFLCLCQPGFTSVGDACLGKSMHYATDVQTTLYIIPSAQCILYSFPWL